MSEVCRVNPNVVCADSSECPKAEVAVLDTKIDTVETHLGFPVRSDSNGKAVVELCLGSFKQPTRSEGDLQALLAQAPHPGQQSPYKPDQLQGVLVEVSRQIPEARKG